MGGINRPKGNKMKLPTKFNKTQTRIIAMAKIYGGFSFNPREKRIRQELLKLQAMGVVKYSGIDTLFKLTENFSK